MKTTALIILISLILLNCTKEYSAMSAEEKRQVPTMEITKDVKSKPIDIEEAQELVENYSEFLKHKVKFEGGIFSSKIFLRNILHDSLECIKCEGSNNPFGFPSYSISADTIREIVKNNNVKKILFYPAAHKNSDKKYGFTIVLVGADDNRKAVKRVRPDRVIKPASTDDLEIWQYIDPCKPNCDQVH